MAAARPALPAPALLKGGKVLSRLGLRSRFLLVLVGVFGVIIAVNVLHVIEHRAQRIETSAEDVLDQAKVIAAQQKVYIEHAKWLLLDLTRLPEVRDPRSAACMKSLRLRWREEREFMNLAVAAPDGTVACNAAVPKDVHSVADREYFRQALQTREPVISDVVRSRMTNRSTMIFARSLRDEHDRVQAVVFLSLDLGWIERELGKLRLSPDARLSAVDGRGNVLLLLPDLPQRHYSNVANWALFKLALARGGEGTAEARGLDGVTRIYGFLPLAQTASGPIYLWLGMPKSTVVAAANRELVQDLSIALVLLAALVALVYRAGDRMFVRRLLALDRAAAQLGQGNLRARAGLAASDDEIGRLAGSFDSMAQALESKDESLQNSNRELKRTNRALRVLSAGNRTLVRAGDEQSLLQDMCRAIVEAGAYRAAWVSGCNGTETLQTVASWGVELDASAMHREAPRRALASGAPVVETFELPGASPHPTLSLPLIIDGEAKGVLSIVAQDAAGFADDEIVLLGESAADLGFGISTLHSQRERARLETVAKTSEERLRAAAQASPDAFFILTGIREQGKIVDFEINDLNPESERRLGLSRSELLGRRFSELLPPGNAAAHLERYARVVESRQPLEHEFRVQNPDFPASWLRQQVVPVGNGVAIFSRDISEWKHSGDRIRESENRLRLAMEAARMGAWSRDALSDEYSFSDSFGPIFGLAPGQGPRTHEAWIALVHPEDRDRVREVMRETLASNAPSRLEYRVVWPDASVHWVESRSSSDCDADGRVLRRHGVLMDITERRRLEYEHAHHEEILRTSLEESIQAIADTVGMRDPYTSGHQRRVAELAGAIGREMGLSEDRIHGIRLAAGIHDLGKIKIPAEILAKPGSLSEIEFLFIQSHAQAGYEILKDIAFPWPIATIVWQHHERMDGSGYPRGLKGDDILLESRIMAVADTVEAMSSHRPYRPGLGIEVALEEIERGLGSRYDAAVAKACLVLFREGRFGFSAPI